MKKTLLLDQFEKVFLIAKVYHKDGHRVPFLFFGGYFFNPVQVFLSQYYCTSTLDTLWGFFIYFLAGMIFQKSCFLPNQKEKDVFKQNKTISQSVQSTTVVVR